jgi:G3E family GTPase
LNLLFGFLGSGKTTLARRLLDQPPDDRKTAIIVNEFGDVGVDGAILSGRNVNLVELNSGCLCCTLKGPMLQAVEELHTKNGAQRIIVEATGVAQPEELLETFADRSLSVRYNVGPIVTIVDASRYARLSEMLGEFYSAQIEKADLIVLNKTDLATAEALENVRKEVVKLNPGAEIMFSERCDVSVEEVLNGPSSALVLSAEGVHDASALRSFFSALPPAVWRAKGFVQADGFPVVQKGAYLVQYAMGNLEITRSEPRVNYNIVFIGRGMDKEKLNAELQQTLSRGPGH